MEQVGIRGRVDAAVDVATPGDRLRVVDARDAAGGGDGVGEIGIGGAGAAERHASPGFVIAGDDPEVGVRAPAAGDHAADRVLERRGGEDSTRNPAADHRGGREPARVGERAERQPPGAGTDRRQGPLQLEPGATGAVGLGGWPPVDVIDAFEHLPTGVGDHEPGRDAGGAQCADHRAGRGAHHVVGRGRVPAGLLGERVQPAGEPGTPLDPTSAEDESNLHRVREAYLPERASRSTAWRVHGAWRNKRAKRPA